MVPLVCSKTHAAQMLDCTPTLITKLEQAGVLRRRPDIKAPRYRIKDVRALAGMDEDEMYNFVSPFMMKKMEAELKRKDLEVQRLQNMIRNICAAANLAVVDLEGGNHEVGKNPAGSVRTPYSGDAHSESLDAGG